MDISGDLTGTTVAGRSSESTTTGNNGAGGRATNGYVKEPLLVDAKSNGENNDIYLEARTGSHKSDGGVVNGEGSTKVGVQHNEISGPQKGYPLDNKAPPKPEGTDTLRFSTFSSHTKDQELKEVQARSLSVGSGQIPGPFVRDTEEGAAVVTSPALVERPAVQSQQVADIGTPFSLKRIDTNQHSPSSHDRERDRILKLSPAKIHELTSSPESLTLHSIPPRPDRRQSTSCVELSADSFKSSGTLDTPMGKRVPNGTPRRIKSPRRKLSSGKNVHLEDPPDFLGSAQMAPPHSTRRKSYSTRAVSTPDTAQQRRASASGDRLANSWSSRPRVDGKSRQDQSSIPNPPPSPIPQSIPLPPFSIPTYLQLELASDRPSPLYIHRSAKNDFPYESSRAKLERLQNFFLLPPILEQVLIFGTLACLDAWLYYFTILPLRFLKSVFLLVQSWAINIGAEVQFISGFIVTGIGRVWRRRQRRVLQTTTNGHSQKTHGDTVHPELNVSNDPSNHENPFFGNDTKNQTPENGRPRHASISRRHRRNRSIPSTLLPNDKADILKGLLMICTCLVLMRFDASRMYHWIRGQAAIKLYVIYNVLEVGDRLFSAIGQDVLECLFSREALERKPDGRSKILRPFWLFIIALIYTVIHSTALFYQVITLNVAVNSYSNALITLLLSNQFVEIKSTVFKKFEKENLFQLTCADVVERFQLWLMLTIIASRNIVETGIFSFGGGLSLFASKTASPSTNGTTFVTPPRTASSILPQAFTILPSSLLSSLSKVNSFLPTIGHLLGPFLVVLGSEMLVDWLKHAYINKFNNTRPAMYSRFLDILTKDYYTNAFADQNLNRRLGLPVIPLACLFFRVSVQTYQMFLTSWLPQTQSSFVSPSNTTSLSSIHEHYSPSPSPSAPLLFPFSPLETTFSLSKLSTLFQSLVAHATPSPAAFIPIFTTILILLLYLTLLLAKLILGIILLSYARARYKKMKALERDAASATTANNTSSKQASAPSAQAPATSNPPPSLNPDIVEGARRVGGWGAVEVGEDRRRWIYADDPEGARRLRERDERDRVGKPDAGGIAGIEGVMRYEMAAKRIW
ncbi:hypothetical protein AJ79_03134 [Helicocarpus griseus UAMH5409]|uniref:Cytomegalovirus gH-receptor family protein n=1 Tax=Helicocarpus griseus UAMH5409 TaxID=1447875 RepID=A0A2B7Y0B6_9EURO|nr:hypothetical protein AJ79_03134 [Helicocarpus griseus UAMH5409]